MNEEKLLEKIKQSADSCEIPDSLKPENIADKLVDKSAKGMGKRSYQFAGVVAAVLALVVGISTMSGLGNIKNNNLEASIAADSMSEESMEAEEDTTASVKEFADVFEKASSYSDVLSAMDEYEDSLRAEYDTDMGGFFDGLGDMFSGFSDKSVAEEATTDLALTAEMEAPAEDSGGGTSDYSTTNLQVEGVDEGDIVKTDGQYIYVISESSKIRIIKIDGANMNELTSVIIENASGEERVLEIYLENDNLNVITQSHGNRLKQSEEDTYYMEYSSQAKIYTYDLSNPEEPKLLGEVAQDGEYSSSRKVDGYLYLFTSFYPERGNIWTDEALQNEARDMVPYIGDEMIEPTNIYLPIKPSTCNYMVISSINIEEPSEIIDKKAILQNASDFYVTKKNIYIRNNQWGRNRDNTAIAKFSFKEGIITGESAGMVAGRITDTFAINEYEDTLRVLTTVRNNGFSLSYLENQVTVFDDKMVIIGSIKGLAREETIYSARFMGKIGYFVTYKDVDPLFAVDFSDPSNPKVLSELKITGFSEYLHFYGKDKLLGIGWETDPETGAREGMKMSMFDISNPNDVSEIDKMVIKNINSFPGEHDYKALTVIPDKNVIGLIGSSYGGRVESGNEYSYMVFSYEEGKGFREQLLYTFDPERSGSRGYENARGLYVGETFYVVANDDVFAFDMKRNYQKIGELLYLEE